MFGQMILVSVILAQTAGAPAPQAQAAFERGERALQQSQLDDAEAAYRDALEVAPKYAEALNGLGSVLFKKGQREEAIAQFRAATEADPRFALAYFNLGFAARRTKDFAAAARAYETYTRLKPEDPDGFYGLAESYRELGDRQKAIAAYEQYIQRENRPSEQKWVDRAKESVAKLRAEAAATPSAPAQPPAVASVPQTSHGSAQGPQAPQTTPPNPSGQAAAVAPGGQPGPGGAGARAERPEVPAPGPAPSSGAGGLGTRGARPGGGDGVGAPSELARTRLADGDRFMAEKNYREASFAYQDAVNAAPDNVEALFKLGNTYAVLGYYAQAIERWNRVLQVSGDAAVRKSAEDNITRAKARMEQAGGSSPQAQGQAPGSGPVAQATRAQARQAYESGVRQINGRDFESAVKSLTQAIQLEPGLAVAYIARGSAYVGLRRFNEAVQDYQYAHRLDPNLSSPLYGLAESFRALGRNSDARQFYERYAQSTAADVRPELQVQAREKAAQLR